MVTAVRCCSAASTVCAVSAFLCACFLWSCAVSVGVSLLCLCRVWWWRRARRGCLLSLCVFCCLCAASAFVSVAVCAVSSVVSAAAVSAVSVFFVFCGLCPRDSPCFLCLMPCPPCAVSLSFFLCVCVSRCCCVCRQKKRGNATGTSDAGDTRRTQRKRRT